MTAPALRLDDIVAARLLLAGTAGATRSEIDKALATLGTALSKADWRRALATACERLVADGQATQVGAARFAATAAARETLTGRLGLPTRLTGLRWPTLRGTYLVPAALGLPAPSGDGKRRLTAQGGLQAAILWSCYRLAFRDYPTLTQARDRLLWAHLLADDTAAGLRRRRSDLGERPFTQAALMTAVLNDMLQTERELAWRSALAQLAAKAVGARRIEVEALRTAILARALTAPGAAAPPHRADASLDYAAFADDVGQAARHSSTGRFGDGKVFICHVWEQMQGAGTDRGLDLAAFKQHLLEARRRGLVRLSRADLSYLLDPNHVSASTIEHDGDTLHFVRLD